MNTIATLTSKGQLTIPAATRRRMGLKQGDKVIFDENASSETVTIRKVMTIEEIHVMNQAIMKRNGTSLKNYKSGDGFRTHVAERYKDFLQK